MRVRSTRMWTCLVALGLTGCSTYFPLSTRQNVRLRRHARPHAAAHPVECDRGCRSARHPAPMQQDMWLAALRYALLGSGPAWRQSRLLIMVLASAAAAAAVAKMPARLAPITTTFRSLGVIMKSDGYSLDSSSVAEWLGCV
jgi:hypothetical protein